MEKQLEQALADFVNKALSMLESSEHVVIDELPDVIQQLLLWHGIHNFILFLIGVLLFTLLIIANIKQYYYLKNNFDEIDDKRWFVILMAEPAGVVINDTVDVKDD